MGIYRPVVRKFQYKSIDIIQKLRFSEVNVWIYRPTVSRIAIQTYRYYTIIAFTWGKYENLSYGEI